MKKLNFLILLALLAFCKPTQAQDDDKKVEFKGYAQMYYSFAQQGEDETTNGFSIRRLRFAPHGKINDKFKWGFQLGFDKANFSLLDVYLRYEMNEMFNIKAGKFATPGSRSGAYADALFSTTKMTCIQRSMVTQYWKVYSSLHGYRNVGIQVDGKLNGKLYYAIMLSNYSGNELFTPNVANLNNNGHDMNYAVTGRLEYFISGEFSIGGFFETGLREDENYNGSAYTINSEKTSFGFHTLYRDENIRFMAEYIKGKNDNKEPIYINGSLDILKINREYDGFFVEGGYVIGKLMPVARFSYFKLEENLDDNFTNITLGVNYYPTKNIKLQANYIHKMEEFEDDNAEEIDNNMFIMCLQYTFGK